MMGVGFYAPLKSPDHPVPSGDRRVAQLLFEALRLAGHSPFLVSRFRSFDPAGDRQARIARIAERLGGKLLSRWHAYPAQRPDLWFTYHLYHKAPDYLGPLISTALDIPYVVAEASFAPKQAGGRWAMGHGAVEHALRRADAVIGLNPADRECAFPLIAHTGRWLTLPPFLDAARYPATSRVSASAPRLITVAMMRPGDKLASYRVLADALAGLLDVPWSLDIVGDGPARPVVEQAFSLLGKRVRYLGAVNPDEVAPLLANTDLFVWPAINEAFCMAVLEAQAAGVPVIAGASGGVGTIVADGITGLLTPCGDAAAFASAVRRLLADPPARRSMGVAASAKVLREHDLPAAAVTLSTILRGLGRARAA